MFAAVCSLSFGALHLLRWKHMRQRYYLLLAAGWLGLGLYWSLIAISAGPAPVWDRGDLATPIRAVLLVSIAAIALGNACQLYKAGAVCRRGQEATGRA